MKVHYEDKCMPSLFPFNWLLNLKSKKAVLKTIVFFDLDKLKIFQKTNKEILDKNTRKKIVLMSLFFFLFC